MKGDNLGRTLSGDNLGFIELLLKIGLLKDCKQTNLLQGDLQGLVGLTALVYLCVK